MQKRSCLIVLSGIVLVFFLNTASHGLSDAFKENIYNPGKLKPKDSILKVNVGDRALISRFPRFPGGKSLLADISGKRMLSYLSSLPHGHLSVQTSVPATTLYKVYLIKMMPYFSELQWIVFRPCFR